jgi:hypothetical protein
MAKERGDATVRAIDAGLAEFTKMAISGVNRDTLQFKVAHLVISSTSFL